MARYDLNSLQSDLRKELANGFKEESGEMVKNIKELMTRYESHPTDWDGKEKWSDKKQSRKTLHFNKVSVIKLLWFSLLYRYTRTLLDKGNGHYNLMILCWNTGQESPIHNHPNSHCFMKTLKGEVFEQLYRNPDMTSCDSCCGCKMEKIEDRVYKLNDVAHITDADGLHRVGNKSHVEGAVTLHLYSPPFSSCKKYDDETGKSTEVPMGYDQDFSEQCCSHSCCAK
ncbi:cysteine dioxygenase type 1-like [Saccostrea echinata]|uniref:cysteine dioxygenase type 1-like n=1 Tax=Saccostrea echinata TaxID=191078 RepID=UPI002A816B4A|nr:cysteine dioxygenase type 1-like [Saccostrea echinata]